MNYDDYHLAILQTGQCPVCKYKRIKAMEEAEEEAETEEKHP